MKSRFLKTSIAGIIFLTLVIGVIALIQPVYKNVLKFMNGEQNRIVRMINERTGLSISYESLSPSVFSGINIRGIMLQSPDKTKTFLEVKHASISYRILDFLRVSAISAIRKVELDGVSLEYDAVKDSEALETLMNLFNSKPEKSKQKNNTPLSEIELPFDVELKNLSLHYADSINDFRAGIKTVLFERSLRKEDGIKIKTNGRLDYTNELLKAEGRRALASCAIEVTGTVFHNWDGSSVVLRIFENPRADFTLSRIEFLLNYGSKKLNFKTASTNIPFSVNAEADFNSNLLSLHANADKLDLFRVLKVKKSSYALSDFAGTNVTLRAGLESKFNPDAGSLDSIEYAVDMGTQVFNKKLSGPVLVKADVLGNQNNVTVRNFSALGKQIDAKFTGSYDIKNMQPSGVLELPRLELSNGGVLQTEVYIDPLKKGFMCFAPQFFMDDRSLTAIALTVLPSTNSVDFSFEFDDYSHSDYEKSGHVKIDGSYLAGKNKSVQISASMDDMFLDSVVLSSAFFMQGGLSSTLKNSASSLSSYIFSNEIYFTSDFKSFSFNAPFFLFANTKQERQLISFSADGSNQTASLSNLDIQFGAHTAHASAGIDFSDGFNNFNFFSDITVNSLPYRLNGSYGSNWLSVSGDYNFDATVQFADSITGSVQFASLPFSAGKSIFAFSTATTFAFSAEDGISLEIGDFEVDEPSGLLSFKPHLAFSGRANRYGFVFDNLVYSDTVSALGGNANLLWNLNDGIFDSIIFDLNVKSLLGKEAVILNARFNNPQALPFSIDAVKNDFYLSSEGSVKAFNAGHFMSDQNGDNTLNGEFSASGTLSNPFVTLNVARSSVNFGGYPAVFYGGIVYDDSGLNASGINLNWGNFKAEDVSLNFDTKSLEGSLECDLSGTLIDYGFNIPLKASIGGISSLNKPDTFVISASSEKMSGSFFPTDQKFNLVATKTPGQMDIVCDGPLGFNANIMDGGIISAKSSPSSVIDFAVNGMVANNNLDINVTGINSNLKKFSNAIQIPYVTFIEGTLNGAVKITGITTDPEFTGAVTVTKPEFYVPYVSKRLFRSDRVFAVAGQNQFTVKPTKFTLDKNPVDVGLNIVFDRWGIDSMDVSVVTDKNQYVPVDMQFPFVHYKGNAGFDLNINLVPTTVSLTGEIRGQKADIEFVVDNPTQSEEKDDIDSMEFLVDLDLHVGNRVQVLFNPLLRGVVVPDTDLKLSLDTRTESLAFKGQISLRGGEIVWLNRNFYMKEGAMVFNETQDNFDPRLTVRAETRERDEAGNQVTITLSVINQTISQFNPRFTATPAKSEKEIYELLGQVVSADSENAAILAMAGGDYLVQATVMRGVENALRELTNFDIFSIRTNILQNAVKQSFDKNSTNNQLTVGNFFDNSAVYVGKYFGSAMYVDALMHWTYDETKLGDDTSVSGLVFQPEFGLEMASPYVNIRLGVAPDLEAIQKSLWMPSTSITLSWKHSF